MFNISAENVEWPVLKATMTEPAARVYLMVLNTQFLFWFFTSA